MNNKSECLIHGKGMEEIMYQIDFNKPETIHFIGIGGISMSGLCLLYTSRCV